MEQPPQEWPAYHIGSREHLHAVGVLVAAWNMIESAYEAQTQLVFPLHRAQGYRAFELLSNDGRVKLIRESLSGNLNEDEKDCLEYFFRSANICKINRNVIAHSSYFGQSSESLLSLITTNERQKKANPISEFSISSVREMADATYSIAVFGLRLFVIFGSRQAHATMNTKALGLQPPALPQKPPLPRSWDQIREVHTPSLSPPGSSQA